MFCLFLNNSDKRKMSLSHHVKGIHGFHEQANTLQLFFQHKLHWFLQVVFPLFLREFFTADSCSAPACNNKCALSILMLHNLLAIVMELLPSRLSGA